MIDVIPGSPAVGGNGRCKVPGRTAAPLRRFSSVAGKLSSTVLAGADTVTVRLALKVRSSSNNVQAHRWRS